MYNHSCLRSSLTNL
ncbi:hypothetical protein ECTW14313_4751, partial [Escherichia coli O157:H7 str. TW14313]